MNMKTFIISTAFLLNLAVITSLQGMQEGSLSFKNVLEHALKIQYETTLNGTFRGNIFKDNVFKSSSLDNPQKWDAIKPKESLEAGTLLKVNGRSAWGQTVDVHIYQPNNDQVVKFIVSKIIAYSIISRDKTLVLHNAEHNITVLPQPNK